MNTPFISRKDKIIDWALIIVLFATIAGLSLPLANTEMITPDASGYLNMGRNLFLGKGAVISYNVFQFWQGKYHPFPPYIHPLYGIVAGFIWSLANLKTVIGFNILLFAVNCVLLYKIIRLNCDYFTSFLIALFMGIFDTLIWTAIFPWTEQLHLFFLLLAIFLYLRNEKLYFWVGIILGVSCLVRVGGVINVLAFGIALIVLKGFSNGALKEYTKIASGFLLIILPYEVFCYSKYGTFYPEYFKAAETFVASMKSPDAFFKDSFPVLHVLPSKVAPDAIFANVRSHIFEFIRKFENIKFALIFAPLYTFFNFAKRRNPLLSIFFFQGACLMAGTILTHLAAPDAEITRYSLIPIITLGTVGLLSIKEITHYLCSKKASAQFSLIIFYLIILSLLSFEARNYMFFRINYKDIYPQEMAARRRMRYKIYEWIKANTEEDVLIASDYADDAFLFERPFVLLPHRMALNSKNFIDFFEIYRPDYIITYNSSLSYFLGKNGFTVKEKSGPMVLFKSR